MFFYTQHVEIGPKMAEIAKMAQNSMKFVWNCVKGYISFTIEFLSWSTCSGKYHVSDLGFFPIPLCFTIKIIPNFNVCKIPIKPCQPWQFSFLPINPKTREYFLSISDKHFTKYFPLARKWIFELWVWKDVALHLPPLQDCQAEQKECSACKSITFHTHWFYWLF